MEARVRQANTLIWTMLGCVYAINGEAVLAGLVVLIIGVTEGWIDDEVR